jgi:hypothetical protein
VRTPTCHPWRKHEAKGLCRPCYATKWLSNHPRSFGSRRRPAWYRNHPDAWAESIAAQVERLERNVPAWTDAWCEWPRRDLTFVVPLQEAAWDRHGDATEVEAPREPLPMVPEALRGDPVMKEYGRRAGLASRRRMPGVRATEHEQDEPSYGG